MCNGETFCKIRFYLSNSSSIVSRVIRLRSNAGIIIQKAVKIGSLENRSAAEKILLYSTKYRWIFNKNNILIFSLQSFCYFAYAKERVVFVCSRTNLTFKFQSHFSHFISLYSQCIPNIYSSVIGVHDVWSMPQTISWCRCWMVNGECTYVRCQVEIFIYLLNQFWHSPAISIEKERQGEKWVVRDSWRNVDIGECNSR